MKTLQEIMTKNCVTLTPQDNVYEAAVKMKEHDIGFIPVVEGKKLLGVITDRDIVLRCTAEKKPGSTAVTEIMSHDIVTASPNTTIQEAAKLLAGKQIRRLPIVENGELVGVVAIADMAVREKFEDEAGEALSEISEPNGQFAKTTL
ncbi:MAG TPA: CBS domain-containing protein [Bacilli bacterium]